jgi:hypothetical protein
VERGSSRLDADTLLPESAPLRVVDEPTKGDPHMFVANVTYTPSFRLEATTPNGSNERRLLTAFQAGAKESPVHRAALVKGDHVEGTAVGDGPSSTVIVFPRGESKLDSSGATYTAPLVAQHIVVGLAPRTAYAVKVEPSSGGCRVSIHSGSGPEADDGGTMLVRLEGCAVR